MREAVRGYSAACVASSRSAGVLVRFAEELAAVVGLFSATPDLAAAVSEAGLAAPARAALVQDLLSSRTLAESWRLVRFVVLAERPGDVIDSLGSASERVSDELDRSEGDPELDPPAGRTELSERIEGYAMARFELIEDRSVLERVEDELFGVAQLVDANGALEQSLGDPLLPPETRRGIATGLLFGKVDNLTLELVNYAVTCCSGTELTIVLGKLAEQTAAEMGRRVAEVRSPFPLSPEQSEQLANVLGAVVARTVELRVSEDRSLIGGVVALLGDTIVDASLRQRLDRLQVALLGER